MPHVVITKGNTLNVQTKQLRRHMLLINVVTAGDGQYVETEGSGAEMSCVGITTGDVQVKSVVNGVTSYYNNRRHHVNAQ